MSRYQDLYDFIIGLDERRLRNVIYNFFVKIEELTYITHGSLEYGADLILYQTEKNDILGRVMVILFQIKKGELNSIVWRNSLHSQLYELYDREIKIPPFDSNLIPRRIVLITSGKMTENVITIIHRMNSKNHIPIEYFDGRRLVELLISRGYDLNQAKLDYEREPK